MELCNKGHKTILATGYVDELHPDSEPFECGKIEDSGFEVIPEEISVGAHWCPECGELHDCWIEEPNHQNLYARVKEAERLLNRAIELMSTEQVSQWEGVRTWLEAPC